MKNNKPNKKNKMTISPKGFSLMEVLISVFVVSIGVVSVFPLIGQSLATSMDSRDQIIASFLAQEGVEIVQNIRDNNWANGKKEEVALRNNLPGKDGGSEFNDCILDYNSNSISSCGRSVAQATLYRNSSGLYVSSGSTATRFHRKIDFNYENDALEVVSMVVWGGNDAWPSSDECNTSSKCAYTKVVLTQWFN